MKADDFLGLSAISRNAFIGMVAANIGLVILLLVMTFVLSQRSVEVRMLPPMLTDEEMRVTENSANKAYAETWALWTAHMVGNVGPESIEDTLVILSRVMTGDLEDRMRDDLRATVENMRIQGFRLKFSTTDVRYDPRTNTTWVVGDLTEVPVRGEPMTTRFTYEIRYNIEFGLPRLAHFEAYEGSPKVKPGRSS